MGRARTITIEEPEPEIVTDPVDSAKAAGLRYVLDSRPGIRREPQGEGFGYSDASGSPITDQKVLERIRSLAIPPAWTDVWICPTANGHLQATGRDARGRKQYRYHPRWRQTRDDTKYHRMLMFGETLPRIREHTSRDLSRPGVSRETVLATVVQLLERTSIRIGNTEYARTNGSVGLTTMRNRHVTVLGSRVHFAFKGKSGVQHSIDLVDRRLARAVAKCREIPGYDLFQYLDDDGLRHGIDSGDVNEYLKGISGHDFTAKDFRTWNGTVCAVMALRDLEPCESDAQAKKNIVQAIEIVSRQLGNTPAVCRKSYVHPAVLDSYLEGIFHQATERCATITPDKSDPYALRPEERMVMVLLGKNGEE